MSYFVITSCEWGLSVSYTMAVLWSGNPIVPCYSVASTFGASQWELGVLSGNEPRPPLYPPVYCFFTQTCLFKCTHTHMSTYTQRVHSDLPHREQPVWRVLRFSCWNLCMYVVCCSLSFSLPHSLLQSPSLSLLVHFSPKTHSYISQKVRLKHAYLSVFSNLNLLYYHDHSM